MVFLSSGRSAVLHREKQSCEERNNMAKIDRLLVGESLVGDGNEVAHIDLIMGPRGSAAETAFTNALTNNKDGFTSLLAVIAPNLPTKPHTVMFNKVTLKGAKQVVQIFGPAQRCRSRWQWPTAWRTAPYRRKTQRTPYLRGGLHPWLAEDDKKIYEYNYKAVRESIKRAGQPAA
jgi:5,6,7,8-tetrahydromethanopterin hydro-lyase